MRSIVSSPLPAALLYGLLFGSTTLVPGFALLACVIVVPFFWLTHQLQKTKQIMLAGYLFTCGVFAVHIGSIIFSTFPLTWALPNPGSGTVYAALGIWVFVTILCSSIGILFGYALSFIQKFPRISFWYIPASWVLTEVGLALLLNLLLQGEGWTFGLHYAPFFTGYALADNNYLLSLSRIGGIFLLTYSLVWINYALFYLLRYGYSRYWLACIALACIFTIGVNNRRLYAHDVHSHTPVSVVSTNGPQVLAYTDAELHAFREYVFAEIKKSQGKIVVLPEVADILSGKRKELKLLSKERVVIDSRTVRIRRGGTTYARKIEYFNTATGTAAVSYKHALTPIGEYMPSAFTTAAHLFRSTSSLETIRSKRNIRPGAFPTPTSLGTVSISTLFCNEIFSPILFASQAAQSAHILATIASYNWFSYSLFAESTLLRNAKVRAVETSRSMIVANNNSPSFVVNSLGEVVAHTGYAGGDTLEVSVVGEETRTLYTQLRGNVLLIPLFLTLYTNLFALFTRKKEQGERETM